jgi:ribonuclease H / adenosylcobalamin/alpha-ribazole phosphatase
VIKKKKLIKIISKKIASIEEVLSISFVGSFLNKKNFSDIDIVIISDKISKEIIKRCHKKITDVNFKSLGIQNKVVINDTFGPLKFNTKKNLVFHLMIYSYEDHIKHVIKSPFTCYDWERTKASYGLNLKDIYPVKKIFSSDLFLKNRGLNVYKKNLISKSINYQKYTIKNNKIITQKLNYKISGKDVLEFCYHVITFSVKNYLKYYFQKNKDYKVNEIINLIKKICKSEKKNETISLYRDLVNFKKDNKNNINQREVVGKTINFLDNFERYIKIKEKKATHLHFKRHLKTKYSKKIFIGQKINPSILKQSFSIKKIYDLAYTSPSLRCIQTAKLFSKKQKIVRGLNEINYGNVEGLTYIQLHKNYPNIIKKWSQKKDIDFPNGESTKNVSLRVKNFILLLMKFDLNKKKYLIVTHNVFLRCLIGKYFDVPMHKWHLLKINYGENINFKLIEKKLFINITRNKFKKIFKNIYENSIST